LTARKRQPLRLESAACPIPVKKQRKYNLSRWAVTGRDDLGINAACQRIHDGMAAADDPDWKELCTLWSSDFRTHITEKRWSAFRARLEAAERRWSRAPAPVVVPKGDAITARHIDIRTPSLVARLDRRRGLALSQLAFADQTMPALGHLPH